MPEILDPRTRHAASHFSGATDAVAPKDIGAAATPQMVTGTSTSLDLTIGLTNQAIVPLLLFHTVTNSGVNVAQGTITLTYDDATTKVVTSANDAAVKTALFTWDDQSITAPAVAGYNAVATEQMFPFIVPGAVNGGTAVPQRLVTIRIQTTGTGATASIEYRYIQF